MLSAAKHLAPHRPRPFFRSVLQPENPISVRFDKNCNVLFYTVYLNSLLLLLVNHVPHLKQCSKRIPIMGVQRPKRLRIHNAPERCHIDLEVAFTRGAENYALRQGIGCAKRHDPKDAGDEALQTQP